MKLLKKIDGYEFIVEKGFHIRYLEPILQNMLWKIRNDWDDYNELFHCCCLMESICRTLDTWIDTHFIKKNESIVGVVLIEGGKIDFNKYLKINGNLQKGNNAMLNYFHIMPEARGNGERWLREVIIPYYKEKGIDNIYLKSSHIRSFSLYQRLGTEVGQYSTKSDNHLYNRGGKIFKIRTENF
ncbi:hypothetical protein SAMN05446037_100596 [Anaerovirgula multivorans]|uniref:Uncharacterized protein n=1 Tax=Anaerovirgula multivorans TaxID=312168 RepID=A0A239CCP4_9FIRM|nr:GNAT family N-acetyltransferase [Anaerovirgula multivorans]SNS17113.1 hypothetical protein SAMN05446037_100596 [Anaerovirgula multivorans]